MRRRLRPALAGCAALLLFLTACAPRFQEIGPPVDRPSLAPNALHMADGVDLPLKSWLPWDRPVAGIVLALHGFNDYSQGMAMPGHGLARRGFAVYAFDQRGFGGAPERGIWPGAQQMAADLATAATLLKSAYPDKPLFLLGESMGAAIIMAALARKNTLPVEGVILSAPAIWGRQTQSGLNRFFLDLGYAFIPWVKVQPRGVRREASSNHQALRALGRDPKVIKATRIDAAYGMVELMTEAFAAGAKLPASGAAGPRWLILFGGREDILASDSVTRFLDSLPSSAPDMGRVALYKRGHHLLLRDLEARFVYDDIAQWMRDPALPLASGADKFQR
jgi:alpha-beta hydrolase superfamily lysophospholipase